MVRAGKLATASAVVSDIMEASENLDNNINVIWSDEKLELMPMDEVVSKFFVRVSGNKADNEAKIKSNYSARLSLLMQVMMMRQVL